MLFEHTYSFRIMKGVVVFFIICLLDFSAGSRTLVAQEPDEYAVKAAYIYNFTKFIQWPEKALTDEAKPYQIFTFGDDDVEKQLRTIDGKNNRTGVIRIHHFYPRNLLYNNDIFSHCHIVFISKNVSISESKRILKHIEGMPILSIGENPDFIQMGGMINFFTKNDRLYFEINPEAAQEQDLQISSRLLKLAVIVKGWEKLISPF